MEWAKREGQIAFALHARMLFQQGDGMPTARRALFQALDVTSVVNGGELRQTKVWPQIAAPFCILFATNRTPGVEAGFRFINPRLEDSLNSARSMRIDAAHAEVVSSRQLVATPEILKILFRGSKADLGILERIRGAGHPTLNPKLRNRIPRTSVSVRECPTVSISISAFNRLRHVRISTRRLQRPSLSIIFRYV